MPSFLRMTSRTALFAVAASVAAATPTLAAPAAPVHAAIDSTRGIARRSPSVPTTAEIDRHRDSAHALWQAGQIRRSRREFVTTIRMMRQAGMLPAAEAQALAAVDFAMGQTLQAGETMDMLVADAIRFGNPDVQAHALLDAMWLYTQARRPDIARARWETLQPLLSSPFVSATTRAEVAARTNTQVAERTISDAR